MLRDNRSPRLAACTVAALTLCGCAAMTHAPGQTADSDLYTAYSTTPATADARERHAWTPVTAGRTTKAFTQTPAPPRHATRQSPLNPSDNLWVRIRNGFQLGSYYGHPSVRRWVHFYLSHDKHLNASLRRARPYLWHIVEALFERGMPLELALLPIVESGFQAGIVSYAGAAGLWQFMPATARDMGLRMGWWYDGRFDALAATQAALDYLGWLHDYFNGNWLLALAAYNAGPGRVENAVARARARGVPATFWNLDLPRETTAYVPKLLALTRILSHPARYSVNWPSLPNAPQTVEVELPSQIEMDIAANMLNMSEQRLRELNPGVKHSATAPDHSGADLLVPIEKAAAFRTALAQAEPATLVDQGWYRVQRGDTLSGIAAAHNVGIAALRRVNGMDNNRIYVGQRLALPVSGKRDEVPTQPYVVQPGDSLWQIAHRHGISVASLRRVNSLDDDMLTPGQTIQLPVSAQPVSHRVQPGDTLWEIAQRYDTTVTQLREWNRLKGGSLSPGQTLAVTGPAPLPDFYHVEPGDTLWEISQRFEIQVATLRNLNDLGADSTIRPGQRLLLQPAS